MQIYGWFDDGLWHPGVLTKLLKEANFQTAAAKSIIDQFNEKKQKTQQDQPSVIHKCLVLDGALNPAWADNMNMLLGDTHKLVLANGEQIHLQGSKIVT